MLVPTADLYDLLYGLFGDWGLGLHGFRGTIGKSNKIGRHSGQTRFPGEISECYRLVTFILKTS